MHIRLSWLRLLLWFPLIGFVRCGDLQSWSYFPVSARFSTKEAATNAIVSVHNTEINGQVVKCSWGKESGDPNHAPAAGSGPAGFASLPAAGAQYPYNNYGQMGYWYPQGYPAAAQMQGMQGYGIQYGYQYGYQQG